MFVGDIGGDVGWISSPMGGQHLSSIAIGSLRVGVTRKFSRSSNLQMAAMDCRAYGKAIVRHMRSATVIGGAMLVVN